MLYKVLLVQINWQLVLAQNVTPRIPPMIANELCNILDITILMNMLAFEPNFRAMSNKVVTS